MAKTLCERFCAGLVNLGFVEVKKTTHYRVFEVTDLARTSIKTEAKKVFVGKSGALRGSRTGRVVGTFVYHDVIRDRVLAAADTPK